MRYHEHDEFDFRGQYHIFGCAGDDHQCAGSPTITTHPSNQTVFRGQTATFNVVAAGPGTITYQWKSNGVDIVGENRCQLRNRERYDK